MSAFGSIIGGIPQTNIIPQGIQALAGHIGTVFRSQQDFFAGNPNGCILSTTGKAKEAFPGNFHCEGASMTSKLSGRRRFLRDSAALVGLAAGVAPSAGAQMSPSEAPSKDCK